MRISSHTCRPASWTAMIVLFATLISFVAAHSVSRNPIGTLFTVQNATIHTYTSRVHAFSEFDISFILHDHYHVKLTLEPNHDILAHHGAVVSYLDGDGQVARQKTIDRMDHKIYMGTAWVRRDAEPWLRAGWARISVRRDGATPLFEGAFSVNHDSHHILTTANYMQTKHAHDPEIDVDPFSDDFMVLYRDSDIIDPGLFYDFYNGTQEYDELKRSVDFSSSSNKYGCQANLLHYNARPDNPIFEGMMKRDQPVFGFAPLTQLFAKRQLDTSTSGNSAGVSLVSTIGSTSGCPNVRKIALIGIATDCTYQAQFSSNAAVEANIISQINIATGIYESAFKISLAMQNLTMSKDTKCPSTPPKSQRWNQACSNSIAIGNRLNMFSAWRSTQKDTNTFWTLLSTCNDDSAVGLSWLGQACVKTSQTSGTGGFEGDYTTNNTVSGTNFVVRAAGTNEWQILAHEAGHTFGAVHDCDSTTCADGVSVKQNQCCPLSTGTCDANARYIMNPAATLGINKFSPCTIGNICSAIGRNSVSTSCLVANKDVKTGFGTASCGNGVVEPGEDCDCGGEAGCGADSCCDAKTCKYKQGAVCDPENEACCNSKCQYMAKNAVCKASTSACSLQQVCDGSSGDCPEAKPVPNGKSCGKGMTCASGQCTSRDEQCQLFMGEAEGGNATSCGDTSCLLQCTSSSGKGECSQIMQNFLDGTECESGGKCDNGRCAGATTMGKLLTLIKGNKTIFIASCAVFGAVLLLVLWWVCCHKRTLPGAVHSVVVNSQPSSSHSKYRPEPPADTSQASCPTYVPEPPPPRSGRSFPRLWPSRDPVSESQGLVASGPKPAGRFNPFWRATAGPDTSQNLYGPGISEGIKEPPPTYDSKAPSSSKGSNATYMAQPQGTPGVPYQPRQPLFRSQSSLSSQRSTSPSPPPSYADIYHPSLPPPPYPGVAGVIPTPTQNRMLPQRVVDPRRPMFYPQGPQGPQSLPQARLLPRSYTFPVQGTGLWGESNNLKRTNSNGQ